MDIAGRNEMTQGQPNDVVHVQTVVIGGGQAGLAVGHSLARRGLPFVILDAHARIGDAWRTRWDSLRLFSAARYDALPGMPFPGRADSFPTKDEMADYLGAYAARFELPVRTRVRVDRLRRRGDRFELTAGTMRFAADNVVVAMGSHQVPFVPPFAGELDPGIVQLHAAEYRNPSQLREGNVLVVGVGNSGGEIAVEVAARHATSLAGKEVGVVPFRIDSLIARRVVLPLLFRFIAHHLLTVDTPLGRRMRPKLLSHGQPLVRVKPSDLAAAGVERVGRVVGVRDGLPVLEDGRSLEVANVIWCTGYRPAFSWIDLPVIDAAGHEPRHYRGIVGDEPGLYFVGLFFQYAMSSGFLPGVGRDAEHVVAAIAARADEPVRRPSARSIRAERG
ncbi:MAG: NAD(P)-binding domain-containing protein [Chloroflexota bacterium]